MQHILLNPVYAAIFGWLAFNVILFRVEKDQADDNNLPFNLRGYFLKTWDNWLASLVCVPVLLFVGYNKLEIGMIDVQGLQWNDFYYLGAGIVPELVIVSWKKWKEKNK